MSLEKYQVARGDIEVVVSTAMGGARGMSTGEELLVVILRGDKGSELHLMMSRDEFTSHVAKLNRVAKSVFGPTWFVPCEN